MSKGYIQQIGTPIEIYNHPANLFVATFIGSPAMNLLEGQISDGVIKFENNYKIDLGKEAKEKTLSFYKTELDNYKKEKEGLLANFVERNLLIEKINHLKTLENNDKNKADIEKVEHELEHVTKSNERLAFLEDAIIKYEEFIKNNKFDVVFGIRPEDIYEENKAFTDGKLSEVIDGKVNVAELLGHEYFVHVDFDNEDLVAKIAAKRIINQEENIKLVLDLSKAHIFDAVSTKIIL